MLEKLVATQLDGTTSGTWFSSTDYLITICDESADTCCASPRIHFATPDGVHTEVLDRDFLGCKSCFMVSVKWSPFLFGCKNCDYTNSVTILATELYCLASNIYHQV